MKNWIKKRPLETLRRSLSTSLLRALLVILFCTGVYFFGERLLTIYSGENTDAEQYFAHVCDALEPDSSLPHLTEADKTFLIGIARHATKHNRLSDFGPPPFPKKYDGIDNKVFISLAIDGAKRGSWSAKKSNLAHTVYAATESTLKDKRFGGISKEDADDLQIEIIILGDESVLEHDNLYEPGIHGLRIAWQKKEATFYNSVAIEGGNNLKTLKEKLCKKAGLEEQCSSDDKPTFYYFPTLHFATTRFSNEVTTLYRSSTPTCIPDMTLSEVEEMRDRTLVWLLNNAHKSGNTTYEYDPGKGKYPKRNNMIRFWMSAKQLATLANYDERVIPLHERNLAYGLGKWYTEEEDVGYIYFNDKSKIGANGMALSTLVASPYFEEQESKAHALARSIIALQDEDGKLKPFYKEPSYEYDAENLLAYYSGEGIIGLIDLFEKTGDKTYLDAAVKSQDYYVGEYVDRSEENYNPPYVPWHTMSLSKLYGHTGDTRYRDAIFTLNDRLIEIQNKTGLPYPDHLGRFYDPEHPEYGVPFSGSTAIYVEGLVYAYELAVSEGDDWRAQDYKNSIVLGIHNLRNLQFQGPNMYYLSKPDRVRGAIKYRVDDHRIRIDTVQHTLDALSATLAAFSDDEYFFEL